MAQARKERASHSHSHFHSSNRYAFPLSPSLLPILFLLPLALFPLCPSEAAAEIAAATGPKTTGAGVSDWNVTAFLEQYWEYPGPQVCGNWGDAYATLHRDIRSGRKPARYITVAKHPAGFGDLLLAVSSAFATALVTSRAIIINDPDMHMVFEPAHVNWTMGPDVPPELPPNQRKAARDPRCGFSQEGNETFVEGIFFNGPPPPDSPMGNQVRYPSDILTAFSPFDKVANIQVNTNGGVLVDILSTFPPSPTSKALQALGLRLHTAYACVLRFLLRPKREVWQPLVPQVKALKPTAQSVAMCSHMRVGDRHAWGGGATPGKLSERDEHAAINVLECLKKLMKDMPISRACPSVRSNMKVLFISDSTAARDFFKNALGERVVVSGVEPQHFYHGDKSTHEEIHKAVVGTVQDWLLFSVCEYYLIPVSGLSRTSMAYSTQRDHIFTDPLAKYRFPDYGRCEPSIPETLTSVSRSWSGL